MSRVFVAEETALGRKVVVKVVAPELVEGLSADRFTREVRLAARLQQANIVPLLSAGNAAGMAYYTMPFVDGLSLRTRLTTGAPVTVSEATHILRDVAKALAYAHAQGVVHRDIKPENVLLSGGTAMVTDFGIAKAITASRTQDAAGDASTTASGTLTSAGSSIGTPAYMAPEQAVGSAVDLRADLYAWGVLAYELLTGAHPFAGKVGSQQLIAAHIAETPAPIAARSPTIPKPLGDVVMQCLAKDPAQRPASAGELLSAFDAVAPNARRAGWAIGIAASLLLVIGGTWMATRRSNASTVSAPAASAEKSLAVLPFSSFGGDTANAYFAEGIADELTTALARLPGLRLAGRSSVARYKQRNASAQEIGTALDVGAVLDGSVRRAGNRIRVSAELTGARDGRVLWTELYEREIKDVFDVQDDITRAIVGALQVQLAGGARTAPPNAASRGSTNAEAYDLYLRGLKHYRRRGPELAEGERVLSRAIALDSTFAPAYATLSLVLMVQPYFSGTPVSAVLPRARAAAERAVALDDKLAEGHLALGHVHVEAYEWAEAEAELRRALSLNPNSGEIAYRLGFMLLNAGRAREAVSAFELAKAADPLYPISSIYLAQSLALTGRTAEALAEARRALDLDPTNEAVAHVYANTLTAARLDDSAAVFARQAIPLTTNPRRLGAYGYVLGVVGAREEARAILRRIEALPPKSWGRNSALMSLYLGLGDTTRALDALDRAAAGDGDLILAPAINSPMFDAVRGSARFAAAMRRFNLDVSRVTAPDGGRSR